MGPGSISTLALHTFKEFRRQGRIDTNTDSDANTHSRSDIPKL